MSEEGVPLEFTPPEGGQGQETKQEGGAQGPDKGTKYNKQGQMVFNVGGVNVTTKSAASATNKIREAAMKQVMKLVQEGKYKEAEALATKILNTPLDQFLKFAVQKGLITEEDIEGTKPSGRI